MKRQRRRTDRQGTTAVEAAFVLPVFMFFVMALVELAHAQMVNNVLNSACRTAARLGSTEGNTTADVESHVRASLASAIDVNAAAVFVKNAQTLDDGADVPESGEGFEAMPDIEVADADPRQLFFVRARINYNDIALIPMPFMDGLVLQGQAFMRHE